MDAPGGTGKTFVIKLLLAKLRQKRKIALAVASSGIAATLLPGGRTAHSTFKLPMDISHSDTPICNIIKNSEKADLFKRCELIVWDECTMAHRGALEALDRALKDIRSCQEYMGGITLLLSGDFRQTLPVIPKGTRADAVRASLKSSYLWSSVHPLPLKVNMRVHLQADSSSGDFSRNILEIGEGKFVMDTEGEIDISSICIVVNTVGELISSVFPNIQENFQRLDWLCERAILAPKNKTVSIINEKLLCLLPGRLHTLKSIDSIPNLDDAATYPIEFLNSLEPPGLPPYKLELKVGALIMLLRNLEPPRLCNGTRLVVKKIMKYVIEARILTGCARGEDVFIPRIPLIPSGKDMPISFRRLQFPVRLSFGMSINKSQGQTLSVAGVHLEESCFSHGQLYVACSRVGSMQNLFVFRPNGKTKNIVYNEVL